MERFKGMWRETWWVWLILVGFGLAMAIFLHPVFYTSIPISIFSFIYFMFMRYDEDGNNKGDQTGVTNKCA